MANEPSAFDAFQKILISEIDGAAGLSGDGRAVLRKAAQKAQTLEELVAIRDHAPTIQELKASGLNIDPTVIRILTVLEQVSTVLNDKNTTTGENP